MESIINDMMHCYQRLCPSSGEDVSSKLAQTVNRCKSTIVQVTTHEHTIRSYFIGTPWDPGKVLVQPYCHWIPGVSAFILFNQVQRMFCELFASTDKGVPSKHPSGNKGSSATSSPLVISSMCIHTTTSVNRPFTQIIPCSWIVNALVLHPVKEDIKKDLWGHGLRTNQQNLTPCSFETSGGDAYALKNPPYLPHIIQ